VEEICLIFCICSSHFKEAVSQDEYFLMDSSWSGALAAGSNM
jgi:hypothetical protein